MTREEVADLFATLNRGDVLELTSRITVDMPGLEHMYFNRPYDGVGSYVSVEDVVLYGIDLRVVSRSLPPEPPEGSVVLDVDGGAWQGFGPSWQNVGGGSMYNWQELNSLYGPLRIIYTAEPS